MTTLSTLTTRINRHGLNDCRLIHRKRSRGIPRLSFYILLQVADLVKLATFHHNSRYYSKSFYLLLLKVSGRNKTLALLYVALLVKKKSTSVKALKMLKILTFFILLLLAVECCISTGTVKDFRCAQDLAA